MAQVCNLQHMPQKLKQMASQARHDVNVLFYTPWFVSSAAADETKHELVTLFAAANCFRVSGV
jgi:hypothetical protein